MKTYTHPDLCRLNSGALPALLKRPVARLLVGLTAVALLGLPVQSFGQTLMMKFGFEDSGTTTTDAVSGVVLNLVNGSGTPTDYHGAAGSGVAGLGKALDFSSATAGNGNNPLASTVNNSTVNFGTVSSFTITMWIKPTGAINYARFFSLGPNGTTDTGQANADSFQGNNNNASVQAEVNAVANTITTGGLNLVNNQWNFVAYTYDGSSTVTIYTASPTVAVGAGGVATAANAGGSVNIGSSFSLMIGNRISNQQRGFPALFDDVRFYTGDATSSFLEGIRESDLPDPSVAPTTISPSSAPIGSLAVVNAGSSGTMPITNQWYFTDSQGVTTSIPGATNTTYVIQDVQTSDAGTYYLVAANSVGIVTNTPAQLTVTPFASGAVNIYDYGTSTPVPGANDVSQLQTAGMVSGGNAQDGLNYYADSASPPGQTFTTGSNPAGYVINGLYVKTGGLDSSGTTTAQGYTLSLYAISGSTATLLSAYVTGNTLGFPDGDWLLYSGGFTNVLQPNTTYAYTHHRNSTGWDLLGYDINNPYAGGQMCAIPPAGGTVTFGSSGQGDATFDLALSPTPTTPTISQQPASQTVVVGQPVNFSVGIIGGAGTPTYQWYTSSDANYSNPTPIANATGSTYSIAAAALNNATNYFVVVDPGASAATSAVATLTVRSSVNNLAWLGTSSFNWDLATANWSNTVSQTAGILYQTGDNVQFTDAGKSSSPVLLATTLAPTSVTVSSSSNYVFAGAGSLVGNVQLSKQGTGTLTISNANTFNGTTLINNGVLKLANASALGNATNSVVINGGTLDLNGVQSPTSLQFDIEGTGVTNSGAINNSSANNIQNGNGIHGLDLLSDATIGSVGRWDLYGTSGSTGLQGNGHNLTKVGTGSVFFIDGGPNNQLGNISVLGGTLGFQGTNDLGNTSDTISVLGSTLAFYAVDSAINLQKNLVLSNAFFSNAGGSLTLNTPVDLTGTNTISPGYQEQNTTTIAFNSTMSGTGGWLINSIQNFDFNGAITYSGPTIINAATLLTVGAGSSLNSSSLIELANANAILSISGLTLGSGQTLSGIGNSVSGTTFGGVYGEIALNSGATLSPGVNGPGTLSLYGDLALDNANLAIDLGNDPTQVGNGINDYVTVGGNLTASGVNTIQITPVGALSSSQPYTIMTYGGAFTGSAANFQIINGNPRYTVSLVDPATTPGSIQVTITGVAASLTWKGGQSPSPTVWDHTVTNFLNAGTGTFDHFYDGDLVTFNDSALTNIVDVAQSVAPGSLTLLNNSTAFTFIGGGNIVGTLDQEGSGRVTIAISNTPALNFITNNQGTLAFALPVNATLSAAINDNGAGQGTILQAGTNTLVIAGNNNYAGTFVVTNGTMQYTASSVLGTATYLYATNGGSLDLNNVDTGTKNIAIQGAGYQGQGALVDLTTTWPAYPYQIAHNITMLGDATIGANARWDITGGVFAGNDHNLTKVGGSQVTFLNLGAIDVGNIDIVNGNLTFQGTNDLGDPTKVITIETNASLGFWAGVNSFSKSNIVIINSTMSSGGSANTLTGEVTLEPGTNAISTTSDLYLLGPVVGTGGFVQSGGANLWFEGTNTYSGPTTIGGNSTLVIEPTSSLGSSSTVEVDGGSTLNLSAPTTLTLGTGQTLIGNGTVSGGSLIFGNGSTLSVGFTGATYSLKVTGSLALQTGSTDVVDVNKTTTVANDQVTGLASVSLGGTLIINNIGGTLAGGDSISLFSAASYTGNFSSIVPATPGAGLTWDTSTLDTDGTLRVSSVAVPKVSSVAVSNGNFILSGNGGTPNGSYSVLTQTNLAMPLSDWTVIGTGSFDGTGNFSFTNAVSAGTPSRFYLIRMP